MGRFHGSAVLLTAGLSLLLLVTGCDRNGSATTSSGGSRLEPVNIDPTPPTGSGSDQPPPDIPQPDPDVVPDPGPVAGGGETVEPSNDKPPAIEKVDVMPRVLMIQADEETCLVKVQDVFPAADLVDLDGQPRPLAELLGEKLSVVFFWSTEDADDERQQHRALSDLEDLKYGFADKYAEHGLRVMTVNVHNTAEDVRRQQEDADVTFPMLLDTDGALFGQIATQRLPRVYLLDADGQVLWFDIEFSRSTRRDLTQAVLFSLGSRY